MNIVYTGAHADVEIAATGQIAPRGVPIEVSAELAESLLEQGTWSEAEPGPALPAVNNGGRK